MAAGLSMSGQNSVLLRIDFVKIFTVYRYALINNFNAGYETLAIANTCKN